MTWEMPYLLSHAQSFMMMQSVVLHHIILPLRGNARQCLHTRVCTDAQKLIQYQLTIHCNMTRYELVQKIIYFYYLTTSEANRVAPSAFSTCRPILCPFKLMIDIKKCCYLKHDIFFILNSVIESGHTIFISILGCTESS